jgi:chitobiase/beta-hexosaminidase-like protein
MKNFRLFGLLTALLLLAGTAMAQTFVNGGTCIGTTSCTSTISVTAGNLVVVFVASEGGTDRTTGVSDTNSDTFTLVPGSEVTNSSGGNGQVMRAYSAVMSTTNASEVFTFTSNTTSSFRQLASVAQYSGSATSLDQVAISNVATQQTSLVTQSTGTTVAATELLVSAFFGGGQNCGALTAGSTWTKRTSASTTNATYGCIGLEDKSVSSTGTYSSAMTANNSIYHIGIIVTFSGPFVAAPTFSPVAGSYSSAQSVTLSTTTSGAIICYTTDGSDPAASTPGTCSAGSTYSTPISVSVSETIKALGTKAAYSNSTISSAAYTLVTVAPTCAPTSGQVAHYSFTVSLADTSPSPTITYCQDTNNTCTPASTYSSPVTVSTTGYLRSAAQTSGWSQSAVTSCQYSIYPPITQITGKTRISGKTMVQ